MLSNECILIIDFGDPLNDQNCLQVRVLRYSDIILCFFPVVSPRPGRLRASDQSMPCVI
jgi:hypothetical protein